MFSKNYLDILMISITSTSFVLSIPVFPVIFCLNLNEAPLLSVRKSIILPLLSKAGSPL